MFISKCTKFLQQISYLDLNPNTYVKFFMVDSFFKNDVRSTGYSKPDKLGRISGRYFQKVNTGDHIFRIHQ